MGSRAMSTVSGNTTKTTGRPISNSRPRNGRSRSKTVATSTGDSDSETVCAISESRGISPIVGLSFVNLSTSEAVLCQFTDTQTYARTCLKINVFSPSEILYMSNATDSKLISIVTENLEVYDNGILMTDIDRKYWSEGSGHDYVQHLAFPDDLESLKLPLMANYFATCCFSAVMKYIEMGLGRTFAPQTLRIRFEPSEGSMMIDLATIASLELIQNRENSKSRNSLFGILNQTLTPMGARFLRTNVLQPSTDIEKIAKRQDALKELTSKEYMLSAIRTAVKSFVDADRVLAALVVISTKPDIHYMEQSVNQVLMLKTFVDSIKSIWQALAGCSSDDLQIIRQLCDPENYAEVEALIHNTLNDDVHYSTTSTDLRNQRVFAIRAGVNRILDVCRQTYKEINNDVFQMVQQLNEENELDIQLKFDVPRQYHLRLPVADLPHRNSFINTYRKGKFWEFQTLELVKMNHKIKDAHSDVINLGDHAVQQLMDQVRSKIHPLFKISESIALLDMLAGLAQLAATSDYIQPEITDTLAIQAGRHPIREKIHADRFVPNDVYATQQNRFQIITGCNMSGKSTYIRTIALTVIMAQIGSFVPATYASFPITRQLFARVSTDDSIEANVSTFASEMRETAFILRNVSTQSLVMIDELGRGTSTTDGLAIAIAIAEALIDSKALVWFVTHFRDLPRILAERAGVVNLHLAADISADYAKMTMRYKITEGYEEEKFYGLALAKVVGLPDPVIDVAEDVSRMLHERNEAQKRNPEATAEARRRKVLLHLREQLVQARDSCRSGDAEPDDLRAWLQRLQVEFEVRMKAIDAEARARYPSQTRSSVSNSEMHGESSAREVQTEPLFVSEAQEEEFTATDPLHTDGTDGSHTEGGDEDLMEYIKHEHMGYIKQQPIDLL
ncbi:MutS protein msh4 [Elasticomyces elasticus]|uniref:MutS protein msh4 n=1 Tax=Exophiala sideris TaxID=1016849 RepID=A0ABR0JBT4_9EURO|nr:MutS protein msh4 [Elasticomyces elasticus]KAK5026084.1 MutS protein msh4 [Exophiala sideris]KAK5032339.1 MutS protein msh4 [Exophiala sideris]KAK5059494.1 MutS protein msh4 [Exophiala sideris]KAK5186657.1 MutS protein msh4 [Eurotiomycetes sp. CCFEE 6388]